jgi:hypothetical protein
LVTVIQAVLALATSEALIVALSSVLDVLVQREMEKGRSPLV